MSLISNQCTIVKIMCLSFFSFVVLGSQAMAQPSSQPKKTQRASSASNPPEESEKLAETKVTEAGKVIEFKQLNLEGTVQKPSAAFLQGRKKIKFKGLTPKKSFIGEIKKSVKKYPF